MIAFPPGFGGRPSGRAQRAEAQKQEDGLADVVEKQCNSGAKLLNRCKWNEECKKSGENFFWYCWNKS
jgi:hypothetical protein